VLQVLTGGDVARAATLTAGRSADANLVDTSFLKPEQIEMASSRTLQLQVRVDLHGGDSLQKAWLVVRDTDSRSGLPWRVLGVQQSTQHLTQPGS
jgi:hypothetical protein